MTPTPFISKNEDTDIKPILAWLKEKQESYPVTVEAVGVNDVQGWKTDPVSGNITHESGKFFSIIGVKITGASDREVPSWSQPMLKQEEVGISGVLVQKKDGVTKYLFYAKFEPGNINSVQISPACQVSEGNLAQAHGGKRPRLAEYFDGTKGRLIASVLGVEDGGRFFHKVNRSMLVEVDESEEVPVTEDYIWLTLPEIKKLLRVDTTVNSLARNVCALL
ncbi:MAG: NDP-hexose 23-dehydratase [Parcubacteria group bacterium Greene0714_7]|nr:MAG: NDP-hexose 23-dehydratase [Parcubacteria group bacterium Greene0714_7]